MPNRRISQFPVILPGDINDQDVLTLVHVFEIDPALRNKKITFAEFRQYLDAYYINTNEVDPFTVGNLVVSGTLTVSGHSLFENTAEFEENVEFAKIVTVTGDLNTSGDLRVESGIVADTIQATSINTVTAEFVSGNFTIATGTVIDFVSGYFDYTSGTTITGDFIGAGSGDANFLTVSERIDAVSGNFDNLVVNNLVSTGNINVSGDFDAANINVTGTISGYTITGDIGRYATLTGIDGIFTTLSGGTISGDLIKWTNATGNYLNTTTGDFGHIFVSGIDALTVTGNVIQADTLAIAGAATVTGLFTGSTINANTISGTTGNFFRASGTTITGVSGLFKSLEAQTLTATNLQFSGDQTVSGSFTILSGLFVSGESYFASGISVTGTVSGEIITAQSGTFDTIITSPLISGNTISGNNIYVSGTITGEVVNATSGHFVTTTGTSGLFETVTGASGLFTTLTSTNFSGITADFVTGVFASGSAAAPSITFTGDKNTGFFVTSGSVSGQPGDVLGFATSGTEQIRINPVGAIGIQGENFGTHGQPLVSRGSGTAPYWSSSLSGLTITGGNINVESGSVFASADVSGLRISGGVINSLTEVQAASGAFAGTVTGNTFTGVTVQTNTGIFNTLATGITSNFVTGIFATLTGESASFTTITGTTVTGETFKATSGIFTDANITTLTGTTLAYTTGTFQDLFVDDDFIIGDDLTISGDVVIKGITTLSGVVTFASGFASQDNVTITGTVELNKGIFGSGTAINPSITFKNDSDTGFYTDAGNKINVTAAGAKKVTITSGVHGAVLTIWG